MDRYIRHVYLNVAQVNAEDPYTTSQYPSTWFNQYNAMIPWTRSSWVRLAFNTLFCQDINQFLTNLPIQYRVRCPSTTTCTFYGGESTYATTKQLNVMDIALSDRIGCLSLKLGITKQNNLSKQPRIVSQLVNINPSESCFVRGQGREPENNSITQRISLSGIFTVVRCLRNSLFEGFL